MNNPFRVLVFLAILPLAGCSFGYDPSTPPPTKSAAAPKAPVQPPAAQAQSSLPQAGPGPAATPSPAVPASSPSPSPPPASGAATPGQTLPIRLSAGTALPQTLPEGTAMGFSVDYQFAGARPEPNTRYFWVIERAQGLPTKQPVQLKPQGTLQRFIGDFRPEQGPFQTHLEDAGGNRLSANEPLR